MNELLDRPLTKNEFYTGMTTLKEAVVAEFAVVPEDLLLSDLPLIVCHPGGL